MNLSASILYIFYPRYSETLPFNEKGEISVPPIITLFLISITSIITDIISS